MSEKKSSYQYRQSLSFIGILFNLIKYIYYYSFYINYNKHNYTFLLEIYTFN